MYRSSLEEDSLYFTWTTTQYFIFLAELTFTFSFHYIVNHCLHLLQIMNQYYQFQALVL